jgi:hypothetical protein
MDASNKGNLITRRAFADTDRMKVLRHIVNKAMSTAYQMTEECGEFGSGTPSPLHMLCESIRESYEMDVRDGAEVSTAQQLAEYPLHFLRELRGEVKLEGDFACKMNRLMKSATDANFLLKARDLSALTPGELKEFVGHMIAASALANELQHMADDAAQRRQFPGSPVQREKVFRLNGTDG